MQLVLPSKVTADAIADPALSRRVRRGTRFRYVGWGGALLSVAAIAGKGLLPIVPGQAGLVVGTGLGASLLLINWTRLWVKESREPFKYTYSVAELKPGPDVIPSGLDSLSEGPIRWLSRDLTEKLGDRVGRLSLLEEDDVPQHEEGGEPAPHVHISGWYGVRPTEDGEWCIEVVPQVRVGGAGAPAQLGSTVRFKLDDPVGAGRNRRLPPTLDVQHYRLLLERVYWAVASKIYAEIRICVEQKAMLLPPGRLRAAAYLNEANDYARSNTLDAFAAARDLYRNAQETYDRSAHRRPTTAWRRSVKTFWRRWDELWSSVRRRLSHLIRRFGRREILAAEAQLGYARMLVAEWNLRVLCGVAAKEIYEAPRNIAEAVGRLKALPPDIPDRADALFKAYVTLGLAESDLQDPTGATTTLRRAAELKPTDAAESSDFLIAEAAVASDPIRSLRLLTRAVERDPKHERAHFMKAQELERLWRRRPSYESLQADAVDEEYAEVIAVNPGNVSAWANRGYIGWLLCPPDSAEAKVEPGRRGRPGRRQRALSALDAGCRYKEVRRDAMVGELNWNRARFQAEAGEFGDAYKNYIAAVAAMLGEPRMGFVDYFYRDATKALLRRYDIYEKRVRKLARAARSKANDRMIDSVLSFVLNDCGGARYSYYRRSGDSAQLHRAVALFMNAIHKNPSFVLPKFNLAEVAGARAADETMDGEDRAVYLNTALQCLEEVIELEKFWTFPRLQRARLEALLPSLESEFAAPEIRPEPHTWLQCLLPHRAFRNNGLPGGRIDGTGAHVKSLLGNRDIWWGTDFNEVQVKVLIRWASTLVRPAPEQALVLSAKLQAAFYPTHPLLLESRIAAAKSLRANADNQEHAVRLGRVIERCESLRATLHFADLQLDPAHHEKLDHSLKHLSREQKLEIHSRAPNASPSDQVVSLLEQLRAELVGTKAE